MNSNSLQILQEEIVGCRRCARLVAHCTEVARVKRRAYMDWDYWGKPVPSFGSPQARLLIIGLAPGAHGSNRTGRMFTGDMSGNILYRVLHRTGFAILLAGLRSRAALSGPLSDHGIEAVALAASVSGRSKGARVSNPPRQA